MEPDAAIEALPFVVDAFGHFPPGRVSIRSVDEPRPTCPELEALIAAEWDQRLAEAQRVGRILFNGGMLRFVSAQITDAGRAPMLDISVADTCYRDFVGTNLFNHHRLGEFAWDMFANPIGTTATLTTADGLICYGLRSPRVAYHASHVHTFGGCFETQDRAPDGTVDPFGSLVRELHEELNLPRDELLDLCCVGLLRDKEIHQPEMLFEARLALNARELRERWQSAEARDEHAELVTLEDQPDAIVPFIRTCGLIAPVAIGALMLHGRRRWGDAWYAEAARLLRSH